MGGLNSYLIGCCNSNNNCPENHCKLKISHSNRSFTFNKIEDNDYNEFSCNNISSDSFTDVVDINKASEEILMTLPGVNRNIAHDIVLHRNQIGKFERIEDIVLVNGIGAAKFKLIKSEISTEFCKKDNEKSAILINQLDVFQLTMIAGFTQALAHRIVRYRDKNGPFLSIKELLRVPGMNMKLLKSIRPHIQLTVQQSQIVPAPDNKNDISSLGKEYTSDDSIVKFKAALETEFHFTISILKVEDKITTDIFGNAIPNRKPTILILLYSLSNLSSVNIVHEQLNNKYGTDYFTIVKCSVGNNCTHNYSDDKLVIISNFHRYSTSVSLKCLTEDKLTYLILTIQAYNTIISCAALLRCFVKDSANGNEEKMLITELAGKLNADGEKSVVFLCEPSLINLAFETFLHNGYHFNKEDLLEGEGKCALSITQLWKEYGMDPNLQIQIKQSLSLLFEDVFLHNFDLTVPLC